MQLAVGCRRGASCRRGLSRAQIIKLRSYTRASAALLNEAEQQIKLGAGANDSLSLSGDGQKISDTFGEAEMPEVKIANSGWGKD